MLEVKDNKFRTDFNPEVDRVFVYGREVNDFRTVDYDALSMLNVSATQELADRVQTLEKELAEMKQLFVRMAAAVNDAKPVASLQSTAAPELKFVQGDSSTVAVD